MSQHELVLGLATIHNVLQKNHVKAVKKLRKKTDYIRYSRPSPGDRVQMGTSKIASGIYQYTSVDVCTRNRMLGLYSRRTASNTPDFLDCVMDEMPFPIQRIKQIVDANFLQQKFKKSQWNSALNLGLINQDP